MFTADTTTTTPGMAPALENGPHRAHQAARFAPTPNSWRITPYDAERLRVAYESDTQDLSYSKELLPMWTGICERVTTEPRPKIRNTIEAATTSAAVPSSTPRSTRAISATSIARPSRETVGWNGKQ